MEDLDPSMKLIFLDDADQLLDEAEQALLQLESAVSDAGKRDAIFAQLLRVTHSLKGSAAAFGFEEFSKFAHELETFVLKLKSGSHALDARSIALLLESNDRMTTMAKAFRKNFQASFDNAQLLDQLASDLYGEKSAPTAEKAAAPAAAPVSPEEEANAKAVAAALALLDGAAATPVPAAPAVSTAPAAAPETANTPEGAESIRVSLDRLDQLINYVGEMLIAQRTLSDHLGGVKALAKDLRLQRLVAETEKASREISQIAMSLRMIPIKPTFQKMNRIVRDISKQLSKEVVFSVSGEDTEIDKTILERLGDPLVHLVRNAVDHGLESTADRVAAGKPAAGQISLSASRRSGRMCIEVRDDGRGLSAKALIAKAVEKGLLDPAAKLTDREAYQIIFMPGFSTKTEVTDISGRGVGMDVVESNITALQGTIEIDTVLGAGTCFRLLLPLTLAVVDGMVVRSGSDRYVVPVSNIAEVLRPKRGEVADVAGSAKEFVHRGESMPAFRLGVLLGREVGERPITKSIALVIRGLHERPFSLLVDDVLSQQQVVIKPLGKDVESLPGVTGGTILGDGQVALILDVHQIIEAAL